MRRLAQRPALRGGGERRKTERCLDGDLHDVDPGPALRDRQQQPDALRIEHEHERHQERRQRVFPGLQRGLVGIAAGDRGGGERRERGRRRDLGRAPSSRR